MRKTFLALILCLISVAAAVAQMQQLPKDPAIKYGVLPNGLTYYVRHNAEPKGQAEFFIAQNVGSMQEEDNQRGLAHFLEHMCFNGTTHFPGKDLINYLESIGVQFGRNLNAYTAFDETVYNISAVPVSREGIVDSCLLILHDWSCDLLLEDKEIDSERGVIHEEWRTSNAGRRMMTNILPQLYPGSRYGYRMPIGTMEIVDNFPYQALRDYYHTWYRPDLQAILVVGDIDADQIVQKIKKLFADIPMPKDPKERVWLPVPDNDEPVLAITSDREQTVNNVVLAFKHDATPRELRNTAQFYVQEYVEQAAMSMLNTRITELLQKPEPPFLGGGVGAGEFYVSKTKENVMFAGNYADGGLDRCLTVGVQEMERARRHGFTASEYDRFRTNYLRAIEQTYTEREKRTSNSYVKEYVGNFTNGSAIPGIDFEYELMNKVVPNVPLDAVNQYLPAVMSDKNMVLVLQLTETEVQPDRDHIFKLIADVRASDIEPYQDQTVTQPLVESRPTGGTIVKEEDGVFGSRVLTLGNGVRVVLKNTDYQKDEIIMSGYRKGGTSLFPDSDIESLTWVNAIHGIMGLGDFNQMELGKVLTGKHAAANVSLSSQSEQASGTCSVRDFETMLQLLALNFRPQRIDQDAFASFTARQRKTMENKEADPMKSFQDTVRTITAVNTARTVLMHPEMVDRIDLSRVKAIYDSRFDHADGFTFAIVGNIDNDSLRTLIAAYLGTLPVKGVADEPVNRNQGIRKGRYQSMFNRDMEMDRSTVLLLRQAELPYTLRNNILMQHLEQALQKSMLEKMREESGATYTPGVSGGVSHDAFGDEASLEVYFQTSPDMRDALIDIARGEIQRIMDQGVSDEQVEKTRQLQIKNHTEALRKNAYYMGILLSYYRYGFDLDSDFDTVVNSITADDVRDFARQLFDQDNEIVVSMSPAK